MLGVSRSTFYRLAGGANIRPRSRAYPRMYDRREVNKLRWNAKG